MVERGRYRPVVWVLFVVATLAAVVVCLSLGSVRVPLPDAAREVGRFLTGRPAFDKTVWSIVVTVRFPRVLVAGLMGASLSVSGCAMQGLLKNPLADGTTLGISSGAGLGAVIAIAFGIQIPALPFAGTTIMAAAFSFLSLLVILTLAYQIDRSLSSNTIILLGIIFSMFIASLSSIIITFAGEKAGTILFWTMGSLASTTFANAALLFFSLLVFGGILLSMRRELNAFAIGEENALHVGVDVKRTKLLVLISVSALTGICVSVGGTIGFVGLVTPHMVRYLVGPNHLRLMPAVLFGGAIFLMLSDLAARTLFSPRELPIGVVTSLIGAVIFVNIIVAAMRKVK
ncbi:MAG: iron ABC transporter permease [Clostridiales Family XIII bacterium]|jgi:iron complex transport system permease protein|nr:iron ABC transporter permease [Clostridiales Family XIII bacterium]